MSASRSLCCWRFAQDMFPGVSTEDIGVWPADDGERVVSVFAERLQRIENAAEPIRAASAAGQKSQGYPTWRNVLRNRPWRLNLTLKRLRPGPSIAPQHEDGTPPHGHC